MMNTPVLTVNNISAAYGQSIILRGTTLSVKRGAVTTVMGRNGVGKTTLLKTIMGLLPAQEGSILFNNENITALPPHKKAKAGIAYVPQGREIIPRLSVYENLLLGLEAHPDRKAKIPEEEIYSLFPILKDFRKRAGGNLSGGQQQQLSIARALVSNPSLLLLDEPTEGIQPSIAQEIGSILQQLVQQKGLSVLLVEQKIDFANQVTDHYYFMDRGRMVLDGTAEELKHSELEKHIAV
ncbi:urea transport system ATP-binding protein [Chitinophaga ginsengisegetis]|uniref:Urea transport system ATP-binding protein n=1 Tax=Chitinophaga ginsengisegetis TaxID=393003 RepID=A0A1T5P9K7_9BACT|nr:urea ABC transporter ATP-binding subunit UrtE [Chitinophaga ginsengisegetis]MDR6569056.1 urea transport system ATP-binding protein [Chitinophaga ginsengisegetis]MDR6648915.1 urea transport system ATP-binding protein [Chitinophaga ginsengisegetis]MDR6655137.1 urea transport system ATP-binding protein [Chitinophaga ginsengisegetis]SKD09401.1 urea transport system ATP-binding protein [Chitinophaga ginsengisegetis]